MPIPFVGRRMDHPEFESLLARLRFEPAFLPRRIVLHHTASPSLAQRPRGLQPNHIQNLRHYYEEVRGWTGAPHLFVDDQPDPIVVFQRLDRRGVHSPSFNRDSWAIEMLGDYDREDPFTGRGLAVIENAARAAAAMLRRIGCKVSDLRFHRDDPRSGKTCPGRRLLRARFLELVQRF